MLVFYKLLMSHSNKQTNKIKIYSPPPRFQQSEDKTSTPWLSVFSNTTPDVHGRATAYYMRMLLNTIP